MLQMLQSHFILQLTSLYIASCATVFFFFFKMLNKKLLINLQKIISLAEHYIAAVDNMIFL